MAVIRRQGKHDWDQVVSKWDRLTGSAKEDWGKLSDDDPSGSRANAGGWVAKIREVYGIERREAEGGSGTRVGSWSELRRKSRQQWRSHLRLRSPSRCDHCWQCSIYGDPMRVVDLLTTAQIQQEQGHRSISLIAPHQVVH